MSYIGAIISTTGYILLFSLFLTGCTQLSGNSFFDSDEFKGKVYYSNDGMDDGRSLKERLETLERKVADLEKECILIQLPDL